MSTPLTSRRSNVLNRFQYVKISRLDSKLGSIDLGCRPTAFMGFNDMKK